MSEMKKNYIGGEWVDGASVSKNVNPSNTNDVVGEYAQADAAQTKAAIAAAHAAFPKWSRSTPQERHDVLLKVSLEIAARRDELGRLLAREEGKTIGEATGEVLRASQIFDFFAGEALRLQGDKVGSVRPGVDIEVTREGVGVVGIIAPWNFPIAIPSWKIAPALAFGNCVVFKPADLVPGSAHALAEIIVRAGAPAGVFNLTMGRGSVVGQTMLESKQVDAITFTGSVQTGTTVAAACAKAMRKCQLEMGGKNPLVVLDDADLKIAVEAAVNGAFFSTGQRCTASSRLDRDQGRLRQVRRGDAGADAHARGGRRAQPEDGDRPGGRRQAIGAGPGLPRHRRQGWREAGGGRRIAQPRDPRLLHGAGSVHRRHERHADLARRDLWPGGDDDRGPATTNMRWPFRTTPSSASPPASAPPA